MRHSFTLILTAFLLILIACNKDQKDEADVLIKGGKYQEAISLYTKRLATDPKNVRMLYNRGRAYEELGQIEKAKVDFERVLEIDENNLRANMSMGNYFYNQQNYKSSIYYFDKAIAIDGRVSRAYLLKARALHQQGSFGDARENYNLAIDFDKKNGEAYFYRGALFVALNQTRKACDDLTRSRELGFAEAAAAMAKHCR